MTDAKTIEAIDRGDQPATHRQLRYLQAVAREAGWDPTRLDSEVVLEFGVHTDQLTRRDASTMIDIIQTRKIFSD